MDAHLITAGRALMGAYDADVSPDSRSLDDQLIAAISTLNPEQLDKVLAVMRQMLEAKPTGGTK